MEDIKLPAIDCDTAKIDHIFESCDEAVRVAEEAEDIVSHLRLIRAKAAELDSLISTLTKKSGNQPNWRQRRYVLDEVLTNESTILDDADIILKMVDVQIARYSELAKDAEAVAYDERKEKIDALRFG